MEGAEEQMRVAEVVQNLVVAVVPCLVVDHQTCRALGMLEVDLQQSLKQSVKDHPGKADVHWTRALLVGCIA